MFLDWLKSGPVLNLPQFILLSVKNAVSLTVLLHALVVSRCVRSKEQLLSPVKCSFVEGVISGIPSHGKKFKSDPDNDNILVHTVSEIANNQGMHGFRVRPLKDSRPPWTSGEGQLKLRVQSF